MVKFIKEELLNMHVLDKVRNNMTLAPGDWQEILDIAKAGRIALDTVETGCTSICSFEAMDEGEVDFRPVDGHYVCYLNSECVWADFCYQRLEIRSKK